MTRERIGEWLLERAASEENRLPGVGLPAFGAPVMGVARGDDALFPENKRMIGDFLMTPAEWLQAKYGRAFDPAAVSVVCWAFPQTERTRALSRAAREYPPLDWSLNRTYGEAFNANTARLLESWLCAEGVEAVAPMASERFRWETSEAYGYASNWSERHAAYAAGLGTFGLCDGLISRAGKAVRYGSVIAAAAFAPDQRDYARRDEYCLAREGCEACIKRCPAGAITRAGHDKEKCAAYQREHVFPYAKEAYGFDGVYGCGLCQTGVPCEACAPGRRKNAK